jgi:hypothetical protein
MLGRKFGILKNEVLPYMKRTWEEIAMFGLREIKMGTPPTHTGTNLKELWVLDRTVSATVSMFIIRNTYKNPDVIRWIEEGTRPHRIPVGRFGFLHFTTYEGTEVFTKKAVMHPGTPAWRMVEITSRMIQSKLDQYVQATFAQIDKLMGERRK